MSAEVGAAVSEILDRAAKHYIGRNAPEVYRHYVWQVHGAGTLRHYDGTDAYWRRLQAALDFFFTAEQRVQIFSWLMQRADLGGLPECRHFQASAVAEARLADLLAGMGPAGLRAGGAQVDSNSIDPSYC